MLKTGSYITLLFIAFVPVTNADISSVTTPDIIEAVRSPVIEKTQEEDSPGCSTTRYIFAHPVTSAKLEFKCDRINVSWFQSKEPQNFEASKVAAELARRAVIALSGSNGIEVEKVMAGEKYKNKLFSNGLALSGFCTGTQCLLTFR